MEFYRKTMKSAARFDEKHTLLLLTNISLEGGKDHFEFRVKGRLTTPGSVTFLWPPHADDETRHHRGWVFLGFKTRGDLVRAEVNLAALEFFDTKVRVKNGHVKFRISGFEDPAPALATPPRPVRIKFNFGTGAAALTTGPAIAAPAPPVPARAAITKRARSPMGDSPTPAAKKRV